MPCLVVLAPGDLLVAGDQAHLPAKFESGMARYAHLYPGEVYVLGRAGTSADRENLGGRYVPVDMLPFGVEVTRDLAQGLRSLRPDAALLPLSDEHAALSGISRRTVFSAEHASRSWMAMSRAEHHSLVDRARMAVGYRRLERRLVRHVGRADGIHCNGVVAWDTYAHHSPSALRVYDSRLTEQIIREAQGAPRTGATDVLRLAFSGRLTPIKGPQYVLPLPELLATRGVRATLDVFGDGPMRSDLESRAGPEVTFHGSIDFADWCRRVPHLADLMVLPHVQPDPSGTYLESAGVGVPIVGFDHETIVDLSAHGFAYAVDRWSSEGLADAIARIAQHRSWLDTASRAGMEFMQSHTFESDFEARIDHVLHLQGGERG